MPPDQKSRTEANAASKAASALARAKRRRTYICTVCGESFESTHAGALYCGNTCKCMAYRARKARRAVVPPSAAQQRAPGHRPPGQTA
jgi:hypothetical protein